MRACIVVFGLLMLAGTARAEDMDNDDHWEPYELQLEDMPLVMCTKRENIEIVVAVAKAEGPESGKRQMERFASLGPSEYCGVDPVGKVEKFEQLQLYLLKNIIPYHLLEVRVVKLHYADGTDKYALMDRLIKYEGAI
jgi:hypothetical protein